MIYPFAAIELRPSLMLLRKFQLVALHPGKDVASLDFKLHNSTLHKFN